MDAGEDGRGRFEDAGLEVRACCGAPRLRRCRAREGDGQASRLCSGVARSARRRICEMGSTRVQAMDLIVRQLQHGHPREDVHVRCDSLRGRHGRRRGRGPCLAPASRPARMRLAAMRLTSHSKGPRMVSSKSLMSKTRRPSGAAKAPRLRTWASPQSWVWMPVLGPRERSQAMTGTAPRKKPKGDAAMRSYLMGTSVGDAAAHGVGEKLERVGAAELGLPAGVIGAAHVLALRPGRGRCVRGR